MLTTDELESYYERIDAECQEGFGRIADAANDSITPILRHLRHKVRNES